MTAKLWMNLIIIYRNVFCIIITALFISSCSSASYNLSNKNASTLSKLSKDDPSNVIYKGSYKVGRKYKIKGKTYKPQEVTRYNKVGIASWYGAKDGFHGKKTANGDVFRRNLLTAAHKSLPLPCLVKVTNLKNKKSLILMVNDRGPFAYNREIDVSEKAAMMLGFKNHGITKAKVEYLHNETNDFLKRIGLAKREGAKVKKAPNSQCSINCHIKISNLKYLKKTL